MGLVRYWVSALLVCQINDVLELQVGNFSAFHSAVVNHKL